VSKHLKGYYRYGKYGFLVLNVEINTEKIDVNVHPAKLEIRFTEEQKVFQAVYHGIKERLLKENLSVNVGDLGVATIGKSQEVGTGNIGSENIKIEATVSESIPEVAKIEEPVSSREETTKPNSIEELYNRKLFSEEPVKVSVEEQKEEMPSASVVMEEKESYEQKSNYIEEVKPSNPLGEKETNQKFSEVYKKTFKKFLGKQEEVKEAPPTNTLENSENVSIFAGENAPEAIKYKYVGALFATYVIIEIGEESYIIDQHAAHERIMYERVKENFYSDEEKDSQIMLLPDIINLTHKEKDIVKENVNLFRKAGFTLEEFGENTVRLIGVPTICLELNTADLFKEILDEINKVSITAVQEKEEKFISSIACKAAVKANMSLKEEEVRSLIDEILKLENPFTCPHGRPTAIRMNKIEVEKKFGRR